jgi:hypothetical protein
MGHGTDFMKRIRWSQIKWKSTEPHTPWQNRGAEDAIQELQRRIQNQRTKRKIPKRVWNFQVVYESCIMNHTVRGKDDRTPY